MANPVLGLPKFPSDLDYQYSFTEELAQDVFVTSFQSGISARSLRTSHRTRTYTLKFKVVTESIMNVLEQFYRDRNGTLKPFLFDPPKTKFNRYTEMLADGSQLSSGYNENGLLRAGSQSVPVRFMDNFSRTLFKPLLESTGLSLVEVLGENPYGKYINFNGLLNGQYAYVEDHKQTYLDLGTNDFMIDFMVRGETVFVSTSASYAALTGKTLIFTIDGDDYTVTFTSAATDAASVVEEIHQQQGTIINSQVFGTTELKIVTADISGYFTISGTAFAQLNLAAPTFYPVYKHDGTSGYWFKQDGTGDFTFYIEGIWGDTATITANSLFHLLDGSFHYICVTINRTGNGQIYVDGVASGAVVDVSGIRKTIENDSHFYINKNAAINCDCDRVGIWSWDQGNLPSDISTRIYTYYNNIFRIDESDGLKALFTFDDSTGNDIKNQEDLILINNPTFYDYFVYV